MKTKEEILKEVDERIKKWDGKSFAAEEIYDIFAIFDELGML